MRRSYFDMIAEILEVAKNGVSKTRIMYRCNLSFGQTKNFVSDLLESDLLVVGNSYHITEKGLQLLKAYHNLELLLNSGNMT